MTALAHVVATFGLPLALYTDRAGWALHTPKAGGPVDRDHLTHVGRALARLGIEHIGAYSPQARGRGERLNRTLQDRLVNELRLAGLTTLAAANAYLRTTSSPTTTRRSRGHPLIPPRLLFRSAPSTSRKSSARKRLAWSVRTTS